MMLDLRCFLVIIVWTVFALTFGTVGFLLWMVLR